eukprot:12882414-Prorocentrum_lima.AAC.1
MARTFQDHFQHKTIKSEGYIGRCNDDIAARFPRRHYRFLSFTNDLDCANAGGRGRRWNVIA